MVRRKTFLPQAPEVFPLRHGHRGLEPLSFQVNRGLYTEVRWAGYRFKFDLNGGLQKITGESSVWPYPEDWITRTQTNRWIYYSGRSYEDIFALTGLYYYPFVDGQEDLFDQGSPFEEPYVKEAFRAWERLPAHLERAMGDTHGEEAEAIARILQMTSRGLSRRALDLYHCLRATVPIIPPETHKVAYQVVPIIVADGCRGNCRFCCLKSGMDLVPRSMEEISTQIKEIRAYYGPDLINYNSVFLGQNDALSAGLERVIEAALIAWRDLDLVHSYHPDPRLFLFSWPEALLSLDSSAVSDLNSLPYSKVHINVGIESLDKSTLEWLGKPLDIQTAWSCMEKAMELNMTPGPLEISLNFVAGDSLPQAHWDLLSQSLDRRNGPGPCKGAIYISPLRGELKAPRVLRRRILQLKARSSWPLFLYLIQGL